MAGSQGAAAEGSGPRYDVRFEGTLFFNDLTTDSSSQDWQVSLQSVAGYF